MSTGVGGVLTAIALEAVAANTLSFAAFAVVAAVNTGAAVDLVLTAVALEAVITDAGTLAAYSVASAVDIIAGIGRIDALTVATDLTFVA